MLLGLLWISRIFVAESRSLLLCETLMRKSCLLIRLDVFVRFARFMTCICQACLASLLPSHTEQSRVALFSRRGRTPENCLEFRSTSVGESPEHVQLPHGSFARQPARVLVLLSSGAAARNRRRTICSHVWVSVKMGVQVPLPVRGNYFCFFVWGGGGGAGAAFRVNPCALPSW